MIEFTARKQQIVLATILAIAIGGWMLIYGVRLLGAKARADTAPSQGTSTDIHASSGQDGAPTADFIAAAMRHQVTASIEVKYSLSDSVDYHYTRTPEARSMTLRFLNKGDEQQASYDFATRETRVLETSKGGAVSGTILSPWLGDPFVSQDVLDPVLLVLPWGAEGPRPLHEWVPSGEVLSKREDVDGHSCWRIDLVRPAERMDRYSIWVDPNVGFCPRRIEITPSGQRGPTVINYRDYRELAGGVWFPMKQVNEFPAVSGPEGKNAVSSTKGGQLNTPVITLGRKATTFVASEASAGKTFSKDSLLVQFPSGTKVRVNFSSVPVTMP